MPGALGLLCILRVPALQVAQVDGLEGCQGQSAWCWEQDSNPSPLLGAPKPRGPGKDNSAGREQGPSHQPPRPGLLTLEAGVGNLLHVLFH